VDELEKWLEDVYKANGDRKTLDHLYDKWAQTYDQHIWGSGNPFIAIMTGFTGRHVRDFDAKVLDAGCGTGNMAQVLHQMGYRNLEGLDPSSGMLAVAKRKGCYQSVHQLILDSEIELPDNSFDAIVASGVLTHGHAPPRALDGMLKVVKPNGVIIFSLSEIAHNESGFGEKLSELENNGSWQKLNQTPMYHSYPFSEKEAHIKHWVFVYKKSER
jgi:2-polyprenyl-3-methyl-5-hydroxy-6-metoxy-1,4-benzoquinol methylase